MARESFFTIGYEQVGVAAVMDTLADAGVGLLVDVRAVAASRRPGFSKRQFAAHLDERGMSYLHLRGLGTPADGRQAARAGHYDDLRRIYDAHLQTPAAREQLDELTGLVRSGRPVCLMCYERHAERCHRLQLAEIVCERLGVGVTHLAAAPI